MPRPSVLKQPTVFKIPELDAAVALAGGKHRSHSSLRTEQGQLAFHASNPDPGGTPMHGLHNHPYEQMLVMITGSMMVLVEGVETELKAGEAMVIPAYAFHTAWVTGNGPCTRVEMFAPTRQDLMPATMNRGDGFKSPGEHWVRPGDMTWEDAPA
ncbi:MAG: cupin domain-containing protein [Betaproteobacteria bacterium]|nr:cupin domain-containing protein [Betaproteobacteria bacterium]